MTTTVVSIRGKSPDEWLAQPNRIYIGRRIFLRTGKFQGQLWAPSLFMNPHSLPTIASRPQKAECIEAFIAHLAQPRQENVLRALPKLRGCELGCWCGVWTHLQPTKLLCHGVVLAVLADHWRFGQPIRDVVSEWMNLDA